MCALLGPGGCVPWKGESEKKDDTLPRPGPRFYFPFGAVPLDRPDLPPGNHFAVPVVVVRRERKLHPSLPSLLQQRLSVSVGFDLSASIPSLVQGRIVKTPLAVFVYSFLFFYTPCL